MTMTDPIADMLTRIRNANMVKHESLELPASNIKKQIAEILKQEGFISDVEYIDDTTLQVYIPLSEYRKKENFIDNYRTYAFYRVAIELEGMNEYFLFSTIKKIENLPVE